MVDYVLNNETESSEEILGPIVSLIDDATSG